jgi:hypothetical protein
LEHWYTPGVQTMAWRASTAANTETRRRRMIFGVSTFFEAAEEQVVYGVVDKPWSLL